MTTRFKNRICLTLALVAAVILPASAQINTETTPEPLRGIFYTRDHLAEARATLDSEPWRRKMADDISSAARTWNQRGIEWVRKILPPPGSIFAYGINGCPACGAKWKQFGQDTCSFDRPGLVVCPDCKKSFPDPDPASPYHDPGNGILVDGKRYYLKGVWNAFVVQSLWSVTDEDKAALSVLAHAYALTGRDAYAVLALQIMDALATLAPTTRGPRDFDKQGSATSDQGRFHFLTSQMHRALVPLARNVDLVGRNHVAKEPSPTAPNITVLGNIQKNLFEEYLFSQFDVREAHMSTMHNHEADTVRAMIATGVVFDVQEYRRWGYRCLESLLANTIDRDGMYYETSTNYAYFARSVFMDMAEMLENNARMSFGSRFGFGPRTSFFDSSKLPRLMCDNYELSIAGHEMNFGNSHPDHEIVTEPGSIFYPRQWTLLSKFLEYGNLEETRAKLRRVLSSQLAGRDAKGVSSTWWLFRGSQLPMPVASRDELSPVGSGKFFSTKALAAFQSGDYPDRRGFLLRGGPNLPHAQDDCLGLNIYDLGRDLSADIGYGIFDSHVHKGWATRAIAHNLVVVDEDAALDDDEFFKKSPGANWRSFYDSPHVKFVDADAASQFAGKIPVKEYRRRVVMVDVNPSSSYYLDVFDVTGGKTRDYSLHAPYHDKLKSNALSLSGIDAQQQPGIWTLAALNPKWLEADFNEPGKSWGERVIAGEYIRKLSPTDNVGPYGWHAPGRGYGFLHDVRSASTTAPWAATWKLQGKDDAHYRAHFLPTAPMIACRAMAPDLSGKHLHNFVVCRDENATSSRFVVVHEPWRETPAIRQATLIPTHVPGALIVKVALEDGRSDYITLASNSAGFVGYETTPTVSALAWAEFSFLRVDASGSHPIAAHLFRGERIEHDNVTVVESRSSFHGEVLSTDESDQSVVVRISDKQATASLDSARFALFSSPLYTHNTGIQLHPTDIMPGPNGMARLRTGSAVLQRFYPNKTSDKITTSSIPLPLTFIHERPTRFLDGKAVVGGDERMVGRIVRMHDMKTIELDRPAQLQQNQTLQVYDFVPGDAVELPMGASWHRHESED